MLSPEQQSLILQSTAATEIAGYRTMQSLWSGYGEILRVSLLGGDRDSVIVKHIRFPDQSNHPRGWNSEHSHQRKIRSYEVEANWYRDWSSRCDEHCRVPRLFVAQIVDDDYVMVLEDLDGAGFPLRHTSLDINSLKAPLRWLAYFHARFMQEQPDGLWPVGSYWHLDTRPDEYAAMQDGQLKQLAHEIDKCLNHCQFQTLVHGDAKLANFCFNKDGSQVSAVDFQYVGGGCGMKDVAYFISSCLDEEQSMQHQENILRHYFTELHCALNYYGKEIDHQQLEQEWRALFPLAWSDFYRFILGWAPDHPKINRYTRYLADITIKQLTGC